MINRIFHERLPYEMNKVKVEIIIILDANFKPYSAVFDVLIF
ncbi:unnamed protein product [Trichobilharzia regenti]|nr:unnamed protein product [Trichobilharzia regenti]